MYTLQPSKSFRGDQCSHIILKLLLSYLILQVCHAKEVISRFLGSYAKGYGHAFEAFLLNDSELMVAVSVKDAIGQLAKVLIVAMLGHIP